MAVMDATDPATACVRVSYVNNFDQLLLATDDIFDTVDTN